MPIPHRGVKGEIVEVRRSDGELLHVDWRIRRFLRLPGKDMDCYRSPRFGFSDARWHLRVYPNWSSLGRVDLYLDREDDDPDTSIILDLSVGVRKSGGGVVKRRGVEEWEFTNDGCWAVYDFCRISELRKKKDRLMPGDVLTVTCKMTVPAARGVTNDDEDGDSDTDSEDGSNEDESSEDEADDNASKGTKASEQLKPEGDAEKSVMSRPQQSDSKIREPVAPANRNQSSDNRGELASSVLVTYSYKELQTATHNFDDLPLQAGGCKIGEGAFGTVYRAVIRDAVIAVKRLKDSVDKQFMTELMTLTNYKHENLLSLIGFSLCPTDQCFLLYEYMPKGSLQDRLACAERSEPLSWQTRLSISYGTALGINYLHTFGEKPMVHRDIKSANILLDQNFVPKVGDFGLVRTGSRGVQSSTQVFTENPSGTLVYMPWEAFKGVVTVKWDTFSFGVILLELLTGLPPFDSNREDKDLVTHMEPCEDIRPKLDPRADWNREAAKELYGIARTRCLVYSYRSRSTISEILEDLRILSSAQKKTERKKGFLARLLKMK